MSWMMQAFIVAQAIDCLFVQNVQTISGGPASLCSVECQGFFMIDAGGTWSWPSKITNEWNRTSSPPVCIHGMQRDSFNYYHVTV